MPGEATESLGIKPVRTRRRKQITSNKENNPVQSAAPSTRKPKQKDVLVLDYTTIEFAGSSERLNRFQKAAKTTSSHSFWTSALAECVVRSSPTMLVMEGTVLIEDNLSEITNICRKLIKEATEEKSASAILNQMRVAVHGLRAVSSLLSDISKKEAAVKVLYHAVFAVSNSLKEKKGIDCIDATEIGLAAFQAMGRILMTCSVTAGESTAIVFQLKRNSKLNLFPVPMSCKKKARGNLSSEQILKIGIQASLEVCSLLLACSSESISGSCMQRDVHGDFGDFISELLENSHSSPFENCQGIIAEIVTPWISFASTIDSSGDFMAFSKTSLRILWDAASRIEKLSITKNLKRSLQLRKHAILGFLLATENQQSSNKVRSLLSEASVDLACTYAWKSVAAYVQQSSISVPVNGNDCLFDFYYHVGSALDLLQSKSCMSYIEFCAYRCHHIGVSTKPCCTCDSECIFACLPFRFKHDRCYLQVSKSKSKASLGVATLSAIFLVRSLRREIEYLSSGTIHIDELKEYTSTNALISTSNLVVDFFASGLAISDADTRSRCYKLLSQLSLSRLAYQISSVISAEQPSVIEMDVMVSLSNVLSKVIGPLAESLIKDSMNNQPIQKLYWEAAMESFSRSALLLDPIFNRCCSKKVWEEIISSFYNMLLDTSGAPEGGVEKAAKVLYAIGKRHFDKKRPHEALLPMMYATELFASLLLNEDCPTINAEKYKLSHRYHSLAFVFELLNRHTEKISCLLLALVYEAMCAAADLKAPQSANISKTFHFMSKSSNDLVFLGAGVQSPCRKMLPSLIKRLAQAMIASPTRQDISQQLGHEITLDQLRKALVDSSKKGSDITLLGIRSENLATSVFRDAPRSVSSNMFLPMLQQELKILLDIGIQLGNSIRDYKGHHEDHLRTDALTVMVDEFRSILRAAFIISELYFSQASSSIQNLARGMIYIIGAGSLLESGSRCYQSTTLASSALSKELIEGAKDYLKEAREQATDDTDAILPNVILASINGTIFEFYSHAANSGFNAASLILCEKAMKSLLRTISGDDPKTASAAVSCLTRTLNQQMNQTSLNGQKLKSSKLAAWNLELSQLTECRDEAAWYCAAAGEQFLACGLAKLAKEILGNTDGIIQSIKAASVSQSDLSLVEKHAIQLRVHLASRHAIRSQRMVSPYLQALNNALMKMTEELLDIGAFISWVASSLTLAIVELLKESGAFAMAMKQLKNCVKLCRNGINQLKSNKSCMDFGGLSWVRTIVSPSFALRFVERQKECLLIASKLFASQGDYRQAQAYAWEALKLSGLNLKSEGNRLPLKEVIEHSDKAQTIMQQQCFTNLLCVKSLASAAHCVHQEILELSFAPQRSCNTEAPQDDLREYEAAQERWYGRVARGDILFGSQPRSRKFVEEYIFAIENAPLMSLPLSVSTCLPQNPNEPTPQPSHFVTLLRRIRVMLQEPVEHDSISTLCDHITNSEFSPPECRAWAFYYNGLLKIEEARSLGSLHQLWEGNLAATSEVRLNHYCSSNGERALAVSRKCFYKALAISGGLDTTLLTRCLLRSLALVSGPSKREHEDGITTAALIHGSIGIMQRKKVHSAVHNAYVDDVNITDYNRAIEAIFSSLDVGFVDEAEQHAAAKELFEHAGKMLPPSWRIIAASICPSGEILLSSVNSNYHNGFTIDTVCIFTNNRQVSAVPDCTVHDDLVKPLDQLIHACEAQLNGMDAEKVNNHYCNESSKRVWWKERDSIDHQVQLLVESAENKYFGSKRVRKLFLGKHADCNVKSIEVSCGNLASKFESALSMNAGKPVITSTNASRRVDRRQGLENLTIAELKDELWYQGIEKSTYSKLRKAGLVDLLLETAGDDVNNLVGDEKSTSCNEDNSSDCLILILDENLHRFPFEGFSFLKGKAISRVPSLPFVLAPLLSHNSGLVHASEAKYVLDPEGNLTTTADRILPIVESITLKKGWKWDGIVGSMPETSFMEDAVTQKHGLLLYCGHGGGQGCLSKSKVDKMIAVNAGSFDNATLILMGCSSGKLVSVNTKGMDYFDQVPIHYEPEGIALSYLCAGSPCVVGNLWDVTDRDIDKYCITLLESFLSGHGERSMAKCVADARSACKMKHLVGLAPVCYGIPVHLAHPQLRRGECRE